MKIQFPILVSPHHPHFYPLLSMDWMLPLRLGRHSGEKAENILLPVIIFGSLGGLTLLIIVIVVAMCFWGRTNKKKLPPADVIPKVRRRVRGPGEGWKDSPDVLKQQNFILSLLVFFCGEQFLKKCVVFELVTNLVVFFFIYFENGAKISLDLFIF